MFRSKNILVFLAICSLVLIVACNTSTEEKIHEHLEEAVQIENNNNDEENSITELEQQEQEIYKEIIELTMDDFDKIKVLSEEATKNIDARQDLLLNENDSYEESENEFTKIKGLLKKLDGTELKEKAEEMYDTMLERYKIYGELHASYNSALEKEKDLYVLLQDEEAEQTDLTDQLDALNGDYEVVIETNDRFNEETEKYNELKKEFYNLTDLNIDYQDNDKAIKADK